MSGRYMFLDTEERLRFCAGLCLTAVKDWPKEEISQIGAVLGDMTKTVGSHTLAGVGPMFGEVLLVHREDWNLITTAYNREIKRLQKVKV